MNVNEAKSKAWYRSLKARIKSGAWSEDGDYERNGKKSGEEVRKRE